MTTSLFNMTRYLSNQTAQYTNPEEFWDEVSSDSVEEYLEGFTIPERFKMPITNELIKSLEEFVIEEDDNKASSPILDSVDIKIVTGILLFKIYTNALDIRQQ